MRRPGECDRRRVAVVDDNELTRLGFVEALRASPAVEVAGELTHAEALEWDAEWRGVDVVLVDAADEKRGGDQFPGVGVVRRVREAAGDEGPVVIVVTGHALHDGLRYRMAQAQADLFFYRSDLSSSADLLEVVLHPEAQRRAVPPVADPSRLEALGISRGSDMERLVGYVEEHGLEEALDPDQPSRADPRSRRWLRHRRAMADEAGVRPVNMTTGNRPMDWEAPSIRQLSRLWGWAARIRRPER